MSSSVPPMPGTWPASHPLAPWITQQIPYSNRRRMATIIKASKIHAEGTTIDDGCTHCTENGWECKVLQSVSPKCARCVNRHTSCKFVSTYLPRPRSLVNISYSPLRILSKEVRQMMATQTLLTPRWIMAMTHLKVMQRRRLLRRASKEQWITLSSP
jgi:hypothetical protein